MTAAPPHHLARRPVVPRDRPPTKAFNYSHKLRRRVAVTAAAAAAAAAAATGRATVAVRGARFRRDPLRRAARQSRTTSATVDVAQSHVAAAADLRNTLRTRANGLNNK